MQGLIVENRANLYKVKIDSQIYDCVARGKFKKSEETQVVGDIVEIEIIDDDKKTAVIEKILPRKVYTKRPKLANITQLIFVMSMKTPKPDLLLLDKQLAVAEYLGINSIIVLNKIDLDLNEDANEIEKMYTKIGYTVIKTDAKTGIGIEEVKQKLKNNISAFSGNSGVGKSTLINKLFNETITLEGVISDKNKKGKNTTTATKLYNVEDGYIADTPGFSTFDIDEISSKDLDRYFIEFENFVKECEYKYDCSHIKEENCGVKKATETGKISTSRYNNYIKIYNEIKNREDRRW